MPGNATRTILPIGASILVDGVNGSDTNGARFGLPVKTLTRAKALAVSGDTILVMPATYAEHDLLKNGVNWHFLPGAVVDYSIPNADAQGYGIFDDRSSGATTCRITGDGEFLFRIDTCNNTKGAVTISNAASDIYIEGQRIGCTDAWGLRATGCLHIIDCAMLRACVRILDDLAYGAAGSYVSGVYWEKGEAHVIAQNIKVDNGYAVWCVEVGATGTNLWVKADRMENFVNVAGSGMIAINALTDTYRVWIEVMEALSGGGGACYHQTGGGRVYLTAQKISGEYAIQVVAGKLWACVLKVTCTLRWCILQGGISDIAITHWEDGTGVNPGLQVSGGTHRIHGGYGAVLNGKGVSFTGGSLRIESWTVDTSATNNAANNPVSIAAAGLILQNCTLVAPALADSLTAASAQTMKCLNVWTNKAKNANVTVQCQPINVDANVS